MSTAHQKIAERVAEIADHAACIVAAQEYDIPDDVAQVIKEASKNVKKGEYFDSDPLREQMAADYISSELAKLKEEAAALGVVVDPELLSALLPAIARTTQWHSSSYGC